MIIRKSIKRCPLQINVQQTPQSYTYLTILIYNLFLFTYKQLLNHPRTLRKGPSNANVTGSNIKILKTKKKTLATKRETVSVTLSFC